MYGRSGKGAIGPRYGAGGAGAGDNARDGGDARSQKQRMLAGDAYLVDDALLTELRHAHVLADRYAALYAGDPEAAQQVLHELLGFVGNDVVIRPPLYVDYGWNLRVGARSFVNYGLVALDVAPITIGEDVRIGPNVQLLAPTHPLDASARRDGWEGGKPIVIDDNAWIGGGAIVLPGVTIGTHSVVGAGAVVTRDVPPNVLVAGNPARVLRRLDEPPADAPA